MRHRRGKLQNAVVVGSGEHRFPHRPKAYFKLCLVLNKIRQELLANDQARAELHCGDPVPQILPNSQTRRQHFLPRAARQQLDRIHGLERDRVDLPLLKRSLLCCIGSGRDQRARGQGSRIRRWQEDRERRLLLAAG